MLLPTTGSGDNPQDLSHLCILLQNVTWYSYRALGETLSPHSLLLRMVHNVLRFRSIGVTTMTTEDTSQMPLFSPEDEKEAQKELKRLRKNENGVFKVNHKRTGFEDKTLWDWLQLLGI